MYYCNKFKAILRFYLFEVNLSERGKNYFKLKRIAGKKSRKMKCYHYFFFHMSLN